MINSTLDNEEFNSKNITFKGSPLSVKLLGKFTGTQSNKKTGAKANEIVETLGMQLLLARKELSTLISTEIIQEIAKAIYISKYDTLVSAKEHMKSSINSYNLISNSPIGNDVFDKINELTEFQSYTLLNLCNELIIKGQLDFNGLDEVNK
ncbi:MAG: hypothetical protein RR620_08390 [Clostridium sp.]